MLNIFKVLIKEISDYRRFLKLAEKDRQIVFYAEHSGYYPNFEGVIDCLLGHNVTLSYITSDQADPILNDSRPAINTFYLNVLFPFFMAFLRCKVFVMTLTELNQAHLKRSINPVHYVYLFHSLVSTHLMYRPGAFDYYDSILCCGPQHVLEIRKNEQLAKLPPKILVKAGYYRLERIIKERQKISLDSKKQTILIAPSWGDANLLVVCGIALVSLLLENGYKVIVRPHPETVRRTPKLVATFSDKFGSNADFMLEQSVASDDSLLRADLLICDCSGVALEYAFGTERPVLFLDVPVKIKNRNYEALGIEPLELKLRSEIGLLVPANDLSLIYISIQKLIASREYYAQKIVECRNNYVYLNKDSSAIGAEHLLSIANSK